MTEFRASSRYQINDPADPTRWTDLTLEGDAATFGVEHVGERTKVFRVLVPKGSHAFGAEFPLFQRERSAMDSSWNKGELPRGEVGIVHKVGVAVAPLVCDRSTPNGDIARVLHNMLLQVAVNDVTILEGSLETLPIGFGVHHEDIASNGLAAMDATPDRYPFLYTNEAMTFTGKLVVPHREWLHTAMHAADAAGEGSSGSSSDTSGKDDDDPDKDDRDCGPPPSATGARTCMRLETDVLVTFYMHGVFGRVRDDNG